MQEYYLVALSQPRTERLAELGSDSHGRSLAAKMVGVQTEVVLGDCLLLQSSIYLLFQHYSSSQSLASDASCAASRVIFNQPFSACICTCEWLLLKGTSTFCDIMQLWFQQACLAADHAVPVCGLNCDDQAAADCKQPFHARIGGQLYLSSLRRERYLEQQCWAP